MLERGISDFYKGAELRRGRTYMRILESLLDQEFGQKPFPAFGYGGAEALFAIKNRDVPNSVFPIFWWPQLANGNRRQPLLTRHEALL